MFFGLTLKRVKYFRGIVLQLGKSVMNFMVFEYFLGLYTGSGYFGVEELSIVKPLMPSNIGAVCLFKQPG
ncbi:hypothetical protein GO003_002460 [Methylicorpusculum oleiharenae]|uniref:hypothetical protein n=1 Tax=Methylicorpusculum oleiharenae TaxID=1338687 RepID=UPI00135BEEF0|nr:hypothetical protein [Methylicorpusculum oleiharenae]MCD2449252.1 hypothetical protein [Methylicorpusculum oleiharenae]